MLRSREACRPDSQRTTDASDEDLADSAQRPYRCHSATAPGCRHQSLLRKTVGSRHKTDAEILRCPKRYIARKLFRTFESSPTTNKRVLTSNGICDKPSAIQLTKTQSLRLLAPGPRLNFAAMLAEQENGQSSCLIIAEFACNIVPRHRSTTTTMQSRYVRNSLPLNLPQRG